MLDEAKLEALRRLELLLKENPVQETVVRDYQKAVRIDIAEFEIYYTSSNDAEEFADSEALKHQDQSVPSTFKSFLNEGLYSKPAST